MPLQEHPMAYVMAAPTTSSHTSVKLFETSDDDNPTQDVNQAITPYFSLYMNMLLAKHRCRDTRDAPNEFSWKMTPSPFAVLIDFMSNI